MEWTLSGVVKPNRDGSFDVDLRGTIDGIEVPVTKRAKATSTVVAPTEADVQGEIDAICAQLGAELTELASQMVLVMAEGNKRGQVSLSRALREIYRPLSVAKLSPPALVHGMEDALSKGIPNVNYAKKVAADFRKPYQPPTPPSPTSRYDVIGTN